MTQEYKITEYLRKDLESIGFTHLCAGWYRDEEDEIRLRVWTDNEIDFYKMFDPVDKDDNLIYFRGKVFNIDEVKWVLDRCFNKNI